jgi:Protein of unknown function (DUF3237)
MNAKAPTLIYAFEVRAEVAPPIEIGRTPRGTRRVVPIIGGTFEGGELKGRILAGGADWQLIQEDGFTQLDSRYTLETDSGDVIAVDNRGVRHAPPHIMARLLAGEPVDPSLVYFATTPTFETAAPHLGWLTRSMFVGIGQRQPSSVLIQFWKIGP